MPSPNIVWIKLKPIRVVITIIATIGMILIVTLVIIAKIVTKAIIVTIVKKK